MHLTLAVLIILVKFYTEKVLINMANLFLDSKGLYSHLVLETFPKKLQGYSMTWFLQMSLNTYITVFIIKISLVFFFFNTIEGGREPGNWNSDLLFTDFFKV